MKRFSHGLTVALLLVPATAFASEPHSGGLTHRAFVEEHRARAEPFTALRRELSAVLASVRQCIPGLIEKTFGTAALPRVDDCAPAPGASADMRRQLEACFANRYRELDNLIVRTNGVAAMSSVRALDERCSFKKDLAAFMGRYEALESAMKSVGGEALVFMNTLGACSSAATRLLSLPQVAIENRTDRRLLEERTPLLHRVAEIDATLDLQQPLKVWRECREALSLSR